MAGCLPSFGCEQGAQFKSREFKTFITQWQASHVMTSPYYPQSNGKLERFHKTLKEQAIRPKTPLSLEDAKRITGDFINYYNAQRLHSAIGYITPADRLAGRHDEIHTTCDKKLEIYSLALTRLSDIHAEPRHTFDFAASAAKPEDGKMPGRARQSRKRFIGYQIWKMQ